MFGIRELIKRTPLGSQNSSEAVSDMEGESKSVQTSGIVSGTKVASTLGWRPIEAIDVGDDVLTFDGGMQTVLHVVRETLWKGTAVCPKHLWPLRVPLGALGNQDPMYLLPDQNVLIESDTAEEVLGDPFALMPAQSLEGVSGIRRVRPHQVLEVITLHFERDEIVFANVGALFHCPAFSQKDLLTASGEAQYEPLPLTQACLLSDFIGREAKIDRGDDADTPSAKL
ncbi:MAG: Hint domain-containing protein [Pseudoruegeria sp.]